MKTVLRFLRDERGTESVEWAIVIGVIAVGAITSAVAIGAFVDAAWSELAGAVAS